MSELAWGKDPDSLTTNIRGEKILKEQVKEMKHYNITILCYILSIYMSVCVCVYICIYTHTYIYIYIYAADKSLQSCPALCDPIDRSPPGSAAPGILQATTLEWVAISFSNAWKWKVKVKSLSHVRPSVTPMDCSLPGSSIHGIFQARVLEWGAIVYIYITHYNTLWQ